MGGRCLVINSLDSTISLPQHFNMPVSSLLHGNAPSLSHAPLWINTDTLPQCRPKQPTTLVREQRGGSDSRVAIPLHAGQTVPINLPSVCFPSYQGFHPLHSDAHGLSLQCLAALLPAPRGALAGGGTPRMNDDVGLFQTVAEGSHTKHVRYHLCRTQTSRKQTDHPAKQNRGSMPRGNQKAVALGIK